MAVRIPGDGISHLCMDANSKSLTDISHETTVRLFCSIFSRGNGILHSSERDHAEEC